MESDLRHALTMLIVSAAAMTVEIVAARMLAPLVGMTVHSWTAVIAVVLAGLSIGHWIGGRIADGPAVMHRRWVFGLVVATAVASLAPVALIRPIADLVFAVAPGWMLSVIGLAGLGFFLPSLLAGTVTPIVTTMAVAERPDHAGAVIGRMYALGAAGAILGTAGAGFVLLQWVGSNGSLALVAVAELAVAALYAKRDRVSLAGAVVGLALLAAAAAAVAAPAYCKVESRYHCLGVVDTSSWAGFPSRGLLMDGWVQSIEPTDGSNRLAIDAHAFLDTWTARRFPVDAHWSAFFIGGGGNSLPDRWVARWPAVTTTVAELDPAVTRLAEAEGFFAPSPRIHVRHADARTELGREHARFDLIFADAYSGHTMPAHLVGLEFHRLVAGRLTDRGVYAINVHDWSDRPRFLAALVRTLSAVFPEVTVWTSGRTIRPGRRSHFNVLASRAPIARDDVSERSGDRVWRVLERLPDTAYAPMLTDDYAPVDRLTIR
ncbi:MAG: fused MFS/spermidine synthase [Alphaproteobacteria bacterium]|nr:fused MFS/spermidine synthase [Alphaproteobacteria bacterium]